MRLYGGGVILPLFLFMRYTMENAQTLNLQPLRSNDELERENAQLRDNIKMLKQRQKDFGDAFLK